MARPENELSKKVTGDFVYQKYIIENLTMQEIADISNVHYVTIRRKVFQTKINGKNLRQIKLDLLKEIHDKRPILNSEFMYENFILKQGTIRDICKEYDIPEWRIKEALKTIKINGKLIPEIKMSNISFNRITKETLEKEYYINGKTPQAIAKESDVSYVTIIRLFNKYHIPIDRKKREYLDFKGDISSKHWNSIKDRAKEVGLGFDLTLQYIWDLYLEQDKKCVLSGEDIKLCKDRKQKTASLDRIDSDKGYFRGQVQWTHINVNRMKWELSEKDFFSWIKAIYEFTYVSIENLENKNIIYNHNPQLWWRINNDEREIKCDLTQEDAKRIFVLQNGRCKYSGISLKTTSKRDDPKNQTASLDRIDSNEIYTKHNVQWVHKIVNLMKLDLTETIFLNWVKKIYEYNDLKDFVPTKNWII